MKDKRKNDIKQQKFVVIDIETSGLDSSVNEITRIEAKKTVDGKIVDTFFSYVKLEKALREACILLTGITNEMLEKERCIDKVLPKFINFISDMPIASYNKQFDISFINAALKKIGEPLLNNEIIDL